jgi:RNA recognition motif-containing protein
LSKKLYVANIEWGVSDQDLGQFFTQAGEVIEAKIILDRETGRSRGFGFVEMRTEEQAQGAIELLNGKDLNGRVVVVKEALPERNNPRSEPSEPKDMSNDPGFYSKKDYQRY